MTLNKCVAILFVLATFCLIFPSISQAGCTKFCKVSSTAHVTFMMNPKNSSHETDQRRGMTFLEGFKAEGHYGGGCNTSVGRQKARKRACIAAQKLAKQAYESKPHEWQKYLCSRESGSSGKYTMLLLRSRGGKFSVIPLEEVKWIQINRIEFKVAAEDGTTKSVSKKGEFTLTSSSEKFACKNGKPVAVK